MAIATWVGHPRSYTARRDHSIQYIVVHYTAGSEGPISAEAGADYDKRRTDGISTHVFADSDSVVREVWDDEVAHAAFYHGNHAGLQLEICGTAQTRAQWLDPVSSATLRMAAKQCAEWCAAHGIPVRRLSVAETRAAWYAAAGSRPKGFVGHVDVTNAYPEDGGTHTDPGAAFPWDVFLAMVAEELGPSTEEDDEVKFTIREPATGAMWLSDWITRRPVSTQQEWDRLLQWGADGRAGKIVNLGDLPAGESIDWYGHLAADVDEAALAAALAPLLPKPLTSTQTVKAVTDGLASTAGQTALVAAGNKAEDS